MATHIVPRGRKTATTLALPPTDSESRTELARTAACEISNIIDMLEREIKRKDDFPANLWRGAYLRLDTLVSVVMSVVGDDEMRKTEEMADEVYGPGWIAKDAAGGMP